MTIPVSGAVGFIGSNFVLDWLGQSDEPVVNLDVLTSAGNLQNLAAVDGDFRHIFKKSDEFSLRGDGKQHRGPVTYVTDRQVHVLHHRRRQDRARACLWCRRDLRDRHRLDGPAVSRTPGMDRQCCQRYYWLEAIAGVPCTVEIASEYRCRTFVPNQRQLIVAISQSCETAATLAALLHAKALGQSRVLVICKMPESAIVCECALSFITRVGLEIGVASAKAFTTQVAALFVMTLVMAKVKQCLSTEQESTYTDQLSEPESEIKVSAQRFTDNHHALFLSRGRHYPITMEGALKVKEVSYIHAEAYPADELKHGHLALVNADMPVISIAPNDQLLDKLKSNLREVQARGGKLYVFADADSEIAESESLPVLRLTVHYGKLSPILHAILLQLLSYHAAPVKGTDVASRAIWPKASRWTDFE